MSWERIITNLCLGKKMYQFKYGGLTTVCFTTRLLKRILTSNK